LKIILLQQVEHSGIGSVVDNQAVSGDCLSPLREQRFRYVFCFLFIGTLCGSSFPPDSAFFALDSPRLSFAASN